MAITKDRQVQRLEVYPADDASADATLNQAHAHIMVCYNDVMDDPDDDDLPVIAQRTKSCSDSLYSNLELIHYVDI